MMDVDLDAFSGAAVAPMRTHGLSIFNCFPERDDVTLSLKEVRRRIHSWERLSAWYQTDRKTILEVCPPDCEFCHPATASPTETPVTHAEQRNDG